MKKQLLLLSFILFGLISQGQITERLQTKMQQVPNKKHAVSIAFSSSNPLEYFVNTQEFKNLSLLERQKRINKHLLESRNESQKQVLAYFRAKEGAIDFKSFYIVNRIVANLSASDILAIDGLPNIDVIDLAFGTIEFDQPIEGSIQSSSKTTGVTAEPGLVAINAPKMWELGYTGKGKKVYVYDTGVWSEHPTFTHRYLGNYFPETQAWYGHFSDEANGNLSSHGTHVLGTIGGLDTLTKDTIGVAFGSYWMACDLINGSTAAGLPPQAELIAAFEWALNPDGDTATTEDIPDVINNSWRWLDNTDTTECFGFIPQLMNTIEAMGIANVFSGGNTGPNNMGVRSPQRINTTDINTFTVGSVNANMPWPHPISSFSTRGPTQCPGSGSLQLFPEVVAPGQNVRSAWGKNGFNTISGTSMASPHVSGALLLLKEAFPNLAGSTLLQALYNTAVDMGDPGEDNVYGRGMIDVFAAYQALALNHTPVDPKAPHYDVAIDAVNDDFQSYNCDDVYFPRIGLINKGDFPIDSVTLTVRMNSIFYSSNTFSTSQLQANGDTMTIGASISIPYSGKNEIQFSVSTAFTEVDLVNNHRMVRIEGLFERSLPYTQDFESPTPFKEWTRINEDKWTTWDTTAVVGWVGNKTAMFMSMSNYTPLLSQKDQLRSPQINLSGNAWNIQLGFDLSYRVRGASALLMDSLNIYVSKDCGQTYQKVYHKGGEDLKTVSQTGADFVPASKADWTREYVDLSTYLNEKVVLLFETVNRKGNNLYIDNISVFEGAVDPLTIEEEEPMAFVLAPNPAKNSISISLENSGSYKYSIFTVTGNVLSTHGFDGTFEELDISSLPSGMYYIYLSDGQSRTTQKFVKL